MRQREHTHTQTRSLSAVSFIKSTYIFNMHESNLTESNFICVFFVIKVHFRNVARERVQRTTLIENNIDEGMFHLYHFYSIERLMYPEYASVHVYHRMALC